MFKTSYLREVRKEKYEHSDVFEDQGEAGDEASLGSSSLVPGLESLQELNNRFARYINRARVLEQRNAVFRKQLDTLQHMEEAAGLEEVFSEQISTNQDRVRELKTERAKLERELKDAERMLEEFSNRLAPTLPTLSLDFSVNYLYTCIYFMCNIIPSNDMGVRVKKKYRGMRASKIASFIYTHEKDTQT